MNAGEGHWYPIASSAELGRKPLGLTRFGQRLVLWRTAGGVACLPDRCPHRGAALSLGRVRDGVISCPFHGLEFAADGRCARVPVEEDSFSRSLLDTKAFTVREDYGYIWLWQGPGPAQPADELPHVPMHPDLVGLHYGESVTTWPAHYTRCIENVCDFSHLPFVHRTTIGLFKRDTRTRTEIEQVPGGFRAHLLKRPDRRESFEFLYPNMWLLMVSASMLMSAVFAPIDEHSTRVYGRSWYRRPLPGVRLLANAYTRFSQFMVFREDWPIVASQQPFDVRDARGEKLLPSDAPVIAYRKLYNSYSPAELGSGA